MLALSSPLSSSSSPAWRAVALIAAVVLGVHALAIDGMSGATPSMPPARPPMVTRQVVPAVDVMPGIGVHDASVTVLRSGVLPLRPLRLSRDVPSARPVQTVQALQPIVRAVALVETAASSGVATVEPPFEAASGPEPPPVAVATLPEVPVYPTRLPSAMTLRYELKRGPLVGQGTLSWRPSGRQYELVLEGSVAGLPVLKQTSAGQIDAAGIAPDRYTDQRLRRGVQAANFQRDKKIVSFSGSTASFTLAPGSQDRLSWMLQLAGIVAAEPKRGKPGGQVSMVVVGVRGEADVWVFDFVAAEDITTARGTVHALRFVREPRKPYDSKVEVWLDPARQFIPAHARFIDGETLDLLLVAADPGA